MFKKWKNKKLLKNEKGLTLVELLAVIVILAIIAAIAVPAIGILLISRRTVRFLQKRQIFFQGRRLLILMGHVTTMVHVEKQH